MTEWVEIGNARLALADCRDALGEVKGAQCLMTDPPYRVTSGGNTKPGFGGWMANDYDNSGSIVACDLDWHDWLPLIPAALAPQAHAYIFSNDRNLAEPGARRERLAWTSTVSWSGTSALPCRTGGICSVASSFCS